jgi:hypothetical protein
MRGFGVALVNGSPNAAKWTRRPASRLARPTDYSQWAADEVGWELRKLTFRRHLSDRGFAAVKGTHGQRMIVGLRLKPTSASAASGSKVLGKLDDGRVIRDDGIFNEQENHRFEEEAERIRAMLHQEDGHADETRPGE